MMDKMLCFTIVFVAILYAAMIVVNYYLHRSANAEAG